MLLNPFVSGGSSEVKTERASLSSSDFSYTSTNNLWNIDITLPSGYTEDNIAVLQFSAGYQIIYYNSMSSLRGISGFVMCKLENYFQGFMTNVYYDSSVARLYMYPALHYTPSLTWSTSGHVVINCGNSTIYQNLANWSFDGSVWKFV